MQEEGSLGADCVRETWAEVVALIDSSIHVLPSPPKALSLKPYTHI